MQVESGHSAISAAALSNFIFSGKRTSRVLLNIRAIACAAALLISVSSCANVPTEAISLNETVTQGISALRDNAHALANSWQDTAMSLVDQHWNEIYSKAEVIYREKRNISSQQVLTREQQVDVAGIATLIRDKVHDDVATQTAKLHETIDKNAEYATAANNSITSLLISTNRLIGTRMTLTRIIGEFVPKLPDLNAFVEGSITTHTQKHN